MEKKQFLEVTPHRPQKASEALQALIDGERIELQNEKVFDFLRYIESSKQMIQLDCGVNRLNQGFTVLAMR